MTITATNGGGTSGNSNEVIIRTAEAGKLCFSVYTHYREFNNLHQNVFVHSCLQMFAITAAQFLFLEVQVQDTASKNLNQIF